MSDAAGIETVDSASVGADDTGAPVVDSQPTGNETQATEGHPAWKEILDVLPSSLHPVVSPALQKWDQGVQQRFQQVQQTYEPYKPFVEQQVNPQNIEQALAIYRQIEADPRGFYDRMGQYVGQGQSDTDADEFDDDGTEEDDDPRYARLMQQQEQLAGMLMQMQNKEIEAQAEAKLDADLNALKSKHGEFDEEAVLQFAVANGGDLNKAMDKYLNLIGKARTIPTPGSELPTVVSPSGATASTAIDPTTLDSKGTKDLVSNLLAQMNAQKS